MKAAVILLACYLAGSALAKPKKKKRRPPQSDATEQVADQQSAEKAPKPIKKPAHQGDRRVHALLNLEQQVIRGGTPTFSDTDQSSPCRISSFDPDGYANEFRSTIGFDSNGESRLLLYFPKLTNLYDEAVITGSISSVEILVNAFEIKANPKSITLSLIAEPWNAFADWETRTGVFPREPWATPGGAVLDHLFSPVAPDIRLNNDNNNYKEMAFNVTEAVTEMVTQNITNYGFQIRVQESLLNAENNVAFETFNSSDGIRPKAALVFNTKDVIQ